MNRRGLTSNFLPFQHKACAHLSIKVLRMARSRSSRRAVVVDMRKPLYRMKIVHRVHIIAKGDNISSNDDVKVNSVRFWLLFLVCWRMLSADKRCVGDSLLPSRFFLTDDFHKGLAAELDRDGLSYRVVYLDKASALKILNTLSVFTSFITPNCCMKSLLPLWSVTITRST